MNREEILAKAQQETDEREMSIKIKAYKYASEVMTLVASLMALYCVVNGFLLENITVFSTRIIGMGIATIVLIYYAVYEGYVAYQMKEKKNIISFATMVLILVVIAKEFLLSLF